MKWTTEIDYVYLGCPGRWILGVVIFLTAQSAYAQSADFVAATLDVPKHRSGCNSTPFFYKQLDRALGARVHELDPTNKVSVYLWIREVALNTYRLGITGMGPGMVPIHIEERYYTPPMDCAIVVSYGADLVAIELLRLTPPVAKTEEYLLLRSHFTYGESPQWTTGPAVTLGMMFSPGWAFETSLQTSIPYEWHTPAGMPLDVSLGLAGSMGLCRQWQNIGLCPHLKLGGFNAQAPNIPVLYEGDPSAYYLSVGAELRVREMVSKRLAITAAVDLSVPLITQGFAFDIYSSRNGIPVITQARDVWEPTKVIFGVKFGLEYHLSLR